MCVNNSHSRYIITRRPPVEPATYRSRVEPATSRPQDKRATSRSLVRHHYTHKFATTHVTNKRTNTGVQSQSPRRVITWTKWCTSALGVYVNPWMSFEVCYKEHDLCYGTETKRSSYTNSSQSAVARQDLLRRRLLISVSAARHAARLYMHLTAQPLQLVGNAWRRIFRQKNEASARTRADRAGVE